MISAVYITKESNWIINNYKDEETDAWDLNLEQQYSLLVQFIYFQIQQISLIKKNTMEKD